MFEKRYWRVGWLGVFAFSSALSFGATVEYASDGASLADILRELSALTGEQYSVRGELARLPLAVRFDGIEATEALKKIAEAVHGQWAQGESGIVLERTSAMRTALAAESRRMLAERIQEALAKKTAEVQAKDWSQEKLNELVNTEAERRRRISDQMSQSGLSASGQTLVMSSGGSSSSVSRIFLDHFIQGIKPEALSGLEPGQRVVFADRPNRMQRSMPVNMGQAMARFREVMRRLERASQDVPGTQGISFRGGLEIGQSAPDQFGKILVSATRSDDGQFFNLQLKLVNVDGTVFSTVSEALMLEQVAGDPVSGEGLEFALHPAGDEFLKAVKAIRSPQNNLGSGVTRVVMRADPGVSGFQFASSDDLRKLPLSEAARKYVFTPAQHEPLAGFVGASLVEIARQRRQSLVAVLDDSLLWSFAGELVPGKNTDAMVWKALGPQFVVAKEESWLTVVPRDRYDSEASTVSRAGLQDVVRKVTARGYARLEDEFDVHRLKNRSTTPYDLVPVLLKFVDPDLAGRISSSGVSGFLSMRFLGSLPQSSLLNEQEILAMTGQLSSESRDWLSRIVFSRGDMMMGLGSMAMTISMMSDGPVIREPIDVTETFPNGIPADTGLRIRKSFSDAVYARNTSGGGKFFTAEGLGHLLGFSQNNPQFSTQAEFETYRMGRMLNLAVDLGSDESHEQVVWASDGWLNSGSAALQYAQLPAEFKDRIAQASQSAPRIALGQAYQGVARP